MEDTRSLRNALYDKLSYDYFPGIKPLDNQFEIAIRNLGTNRAIEITEFVIKELGLDSELFFSVVCTHVQLTCALSEYRFPTFVCLGTDVAKGNTQMLLEQQLEYRQPDSQSNYYYTSQSVHQNDYYSNGQPVYPSGYPYGQPVYPSGYPYGQSASQSAYQPSQPEDVIYPTGVEYFTSNGYNHVDDNSVIPRENVCGFDVVRNLAKLYNVGFSAERLVEYARGFDGWTPGYQVPVSAMLAYFQHCGFAIQMLTYDSTRYVFIDSGISTVTSDISILGCGKYFAHHLLIAYTSSDRNNAYSLGSGHYDLVKITDFNEVMYSDGNLSDKMNNIAIYYQYGSYPSIHIRENESFDMVNNQSDCLHVIVPAQ